MKSPTTASSPAAARGVKAPFRAWLVSAVSVSVIAVTWTASGVGAAASPAARATPRPVGEFVSVSCLSASECMAVGKAPRTVNGIASTGALAEWWNGKTWTVEKTSVPLGADLIQVYAVSCAARNFCVLVGNYVDSFSSVSCVAAKFCVALGNYGAALSVLAAKWNGRTLKAIAKPPTPPGGAIALLSAISCRTTTWCEAVGSYRSGASPLAEISNGKTWRIADPTSTTQPK